MDIFDDGTILSGELLNSIMQVQFVIEQEDLKGKMNGNVLKEGLNTVEIDNHNKLFTKGYIFKVPGHMDLDKMLCYYEVTLPDNAQVLVASGGKFYSDKVILSTPKKVDGTDLYGNKDECWYLLYKDIAGIRNCHHHFDEDELISMILDEPRAMEYIPEERQTLKMCKSLINKDTKYIHMCKVQDEEIALKVLADRPGYFNHLLCKTPKVCELAVQKYHIALKNVPPESQSRSMCMDIVQKYPEMLEFAHIQDEEMCWIAIKKDPRALKYVKEPTIGMYRYCVEQRPLSLKHVPEKYQTLEMCKQAVKGKPAAIMHAKYQDEEMCDIVLERSVGFLKFCNYQPIEHVKKFVSSNPRFLEYIRPDCQTPELCRMCIEKDPHALRWAVYQDPEGTLAAIIKKPQVIQYVKKQTPTMCQVAFTNDITTFPYLKHHTDWMETQAIIHDPEKYVEFVHTAEQKKALLEEGDDDIQIESMLQYDGMLLKSMNDQTIEMVRTAVNNNIEAFKFSKVQDEALCIKVVSENGKMLEYVIDQTVNIVIAAVSNNGYSLKYAKIQTEDICLIAVKDIPIAIKFVEKQTKKICLKTVSRNGFLLKLCEIRTKAIEQTAVRDDYRAIKFVDEQTEELCMLSVKSHAESIKNIEKPSMEHIKIALKKNGKLIRHIKNQTEDMCQWAVSNDYKAITECMIQTPAVFYAAISNSAEAINMIPEQDKEFYVYAVMINPKICQYVSDPLIINYVVNNEYIKHLEQLLIAEGIDLSEAVNGKYKKETPVLHLEEPLIHLHDVLDPFDPDNAELLREMQMYS